MKAKKKVYERSETEFISQRLDTDSQEAGVFRQVALSTNVVLQRGWFTEQLNHDKGAINFERSDQGLPLLYNHNTDDIIGRVDNLKTDGQTLRGDITLSNNSQATEIKKDMDDGFLKDISIRYRGDEVVEVDGGFRLDKWTVIEASIVTIPADIKAGINRSIDKTQESANMPEDVKKIKADAIAEYREAETKRLQSINTVFSHYAGGTYDVLKARMIEDHEATADTARTELLELISRNAVDVGSLSAFGSVDEGDKFRQGVIESLEVKSHVSRDDKVIANIRSNEFYSLSIVEIARHCLQRAGIKTNGSRMDIIGNALSMRVSHVHGVVDFPGILENISNKSMQLGYEETPETWLQWSKVGNLADFKLSGRPNLSAFDVLPIVPDKADYTSGTFSDLSEHIQLATYGKLFDISRQALINDDISGLAGIPNAMGRAASRTVGDLAYSILTGNAAMDQDGFPIFDAINHNNVIVSAVAGVDAADIEAIKLALALVKDPSGKATLGLRVGFFLMPTELESQMIKFMNAPFDPTATAGTEEPNPYKGMATVVSDHRLQTFDADSYYAITSKNVSETIEVAFLDGNNAPTLETDDPFTRDGVTFKVRIDAGARALEFRGMQRVDTLAGTAFVAAKAADDTAKAIQMLVDERIAANKAAARKLSRKVEKKDPVIANATK